MKSIKIFILALGVSMLFINSDCNKVEETPAFSGYILEGRLVNSCTDNSPKKYWNFIIYDEAEYKGRIYGKTDSNGYFKLLSNLKGKKLIMQEEQGKGILNNIPGGESINFGNIIYDFAVNLNLKYRGYSSIKLGDSLILDLGLNNRPFRIIKGPLVNESLGTISLSTTPTFLFLDSSKLNVKLYINSFVNQPIIKYGLIVPCGTTQEVIFD